MSSENGDVVNELQDLLRDEAVRLALDPGSITSPSPWTIVGRTQDGTLLRLDVSRYRQSELSL